MTSLKDMHISDGAKMGVRNGVEIPLSYGDTAREIAAARGYLTDNLMLGAQASVSKGQRWRHLNMAKAAAIRSYENVGDPFSIDRTGARTDIAIGLRYTDSERTEYGIEYYGQSQGYSRNEWKSYFDTVTFINGGYAPFVVAFAILLVIVCAFMILETAVEADETVGEAMPMPRGANWAYSPNG
ncbi:hypothetical protein PWR05_12070 [Paraburkholderia sp. A2RI-6]|uniref:hypothetical protein n=1 Tax=Paraburkholderia sp. A2RI-6 TaxID=3028371 RepID=UPI003B7EEC1B